MKRVTNLAKLSHQFGDTCCITNLKSSILANARCGSALNDDGALPLQPSRKHGKRCCPVDHKDIRQCPKCKKINDAIWMAQQNSSCLIDDNALKWFESQQDARKRKQIIYEEYMSRADAPLIVYTSKGIQFIPPPPAKKEKKNRLDAKKYKRISPEFLRLLQRHHDILHKHIVRTDPQEPDPETEKATYNVVQQRKKTTSYLKRLKKLNTKYSSTSLIKAAPSSTSFTRKMYFKGNKRLADKARTRAGEDQYSSTITHLEALNPYYTSSTNSAMSLHPIIARTALKREEGGNDASSKVSYAHTSNTTLRYNHANRQMQWYLNQAGCSRLMTQNSLCAYVPLSSVPNLQPISYSPSPTTSLSDAIHKRMDKFHSRQQEFSYLKAPAPNSQGLLRSIGNPFTSKSDNKTPTRGRTRIIKSTRQSSTPVSEAAYCMDTPKSLKSVGSDSTMKATDSNVSIPTSSSNLLKIVGDPFERKTMAYRRLEKIGMSPSDLSKIAPSTTSIQTQTTICSLIWNNLKVTKSTQTLTSSGSNSVSCFNVPLPTQYCVSSTNGNNIARPEPPFPKKPYHYRYPRI